MASMKILGVMSGTSLDGLDLALTEFTGDGSIINYNIVKADTLRYSAELKERLQNAHLLSGFDLTVLHKEYGTFIGESVKGFFGSDLSAEYIASHGHTVFHKPDQNLTLQIGDGAFIAAAADIPVISDFRNIDTAFGGQGAPLVPYGDRLLFGSYDFCLNLGGFANISYDKNGKRIAFDICPVNIIANKLAQKLGKEYDDAGKFGKSGEVNNELLDGLNNLPYFSAKAPKSLGREFTESDFYPIIENFNISAENKLRTLYEHIAIQIVNATQTQKTGKIFITGGGAYNSFLISCIDKLSKHEIVIPQNNIIEYKEAVIFALLGLLRASKANNILSSYTGASRNTSGGIIHYV